MKIHVTFMEKKKQVEIPEKSKVIDLIRKLKISPETVITKRGSEILLEDETVKNNDKIELVRIISGG